MKWLSGKRILLYITENHSKSISSFIPGIEYLKLGDQRQFAADYGEQYEDIIQELSIYKVKMENILCKTDIKEQDHLPIDRSLWTKAFGRDINSNIFFFCRVFSSVLV